MQLEVSNDGNKKTYPINGNSCVLGRSKKADIVLDIEGISRQHLKIDIDKGAVHITDLGSSNGVFINGERIEANKKIPYQTFLPLTIGPFIVLTITNDEQAPYTPPAPKEVFEDSSTKSSPLSPSSSKDSTQTKTKTKILEKKTPPKKSQQKVDIKTIGIILLGLSLSAYIYYWKTENPSVEQTTLAEKKDTKKVETPIQVRKFIDYKKMQANANCKDETNSNTCTTFGLKSDLHEGILVEGNEIFVYVNLNEKLKLYSKSSFNSLEQNKKNEAILASKILNPIAMTQLKSLKILDGHVIGFKSDQSEIIVQMVLTGKIEKMAKVDKMVYDYALTNVFEKGNLDLFSKDLSPLYSVETN